MSAWSRFFSIGAEDADRRVAEALAPVRWEGADRYLETSKAVIAIDRVATRLSDWWRDSAAATIGARTLARVAGEPMAARMHSIAWVLLTAVVVHVALTLNQGPRPGWFWMVIPGMVAVFAALLAGGSRSTQSFE